MVFLSKASMPKEEVVSASLQFKLNEEESQERIFSVIATVVSSERNNAIEYFAANDIKVITEVTPVFVLEISKEMILLMKDEPFLKRLDMPSTYKLKNGLKLQ